MDWSTLFLTFVAGVLAIRILFFRKLNRLEKMGILHSKPLPFFGNVASALFRRCHFTETFDRIYRMNENADYVGFYEFSVPIIMIRSPRLIRDITVKNFDHFTDHRDFIDFEREPLFSKNLIGLRGARWRSMRRLLSPAFTVSRMKLMFDTMSSCGRAFAGYLSEQSTDGPIVVDAKDAFTRYTTDAIAACAFGVQVDSMRDRRNDFYTMGRRATSFEGFVASSKFFLQRSFPRISRFLRLKFVPTEVEDFFEYVVRETVATRRRRGVERPDMIQLMMDAAGRDSTDGPAELTTADMTAQAFIFFFGGFDTSSTLMCFVAHEIAVNGAVQERLRAEVDAVLEASSGEPTYEAVNGMRYLDAVISETLRIYPPVTVLDRVCVKRFVLPPALPGAAPVTIEPGQNVWFPAYCIHRDRKYFSEPDKFDPERFVGSRRNDIEPFTYFPFGEGPRMCIGNRFALLETKIVIFYLLANFHLKPSAKTVVPLEFSKASFVMIPKGGFWLQLEARSTFVGT